MLFPVGGRGAALSDAEGFRYATERVCEGKAKYILLDNELLCTQCRENFYEPLNHDRACEFHTEDFAPRSQWRSEDMKWMCCGMEDEADPGCAGECDEGVAR